MYIEPCCIARQLPQLIRRGDTFFQTSGDICVRDFLSAVSSMCGTDLHLTLMLPAVDAQLVRTLAHYFFQEWITKLTLLTCDDQTALLRAGLSAYADRIEYVHDPLVIDGLLCIRGTDGNLIMQGAMLPQIDYAFSLYSVWFGRDADILKAATEAVEAKVRVKSVKLFDEKLSEKKESE